MRKRDLEMIGRENSLAAAVDLVRSGVSIDVVGGRGSGRSTFLAALRTRLEEYEWTVLAVRGVASLRQHPLAALNLAGIGAPQTPRPTTPLYDTAEALRNALRLPHSILFLDDWDDLDESSWGVAESVRRASGIPIVRSRLQGLRARHTPSGLPASTLEPSYVIDMTPLRFEDMEKTLETYLSTPIETGTMSRVFAKSGGNIGLALSLVDASIRERRMTLRGGREWAATRDLWSSGLRAVLEAHLENLDDETQDALEIIAIVGVADLETVRRLVDWNRLELLEERRLIAIISSGERQLVTVVPPLLVEFFRHELIIARRTRLTELIVDRLGTSAAAAAILTEQQSRPVASGEQDALFVRLLQERARARRIVTASEWENNPSTASAVRYIRALMHTHTPTVAETVVAVFSTTDAESGDSASRADFVTLHAQWIAYVDHDLERALALLRHAAPSLGAYGRTLEAAEVRLLANLRNIPDDYSSRLEVTDDLPPQVKIALLETQMLVLVSLGRFGDARRVFAIVDLLDRNHETHVSRTLVGLALLGEGDWEGATELLQQGFDEAHGHLDIDAVRAFGAAASVCHILAGDYSAVDALIEVIFAAGEPTPFPPGIQLSLMTIAAVVAVRRGQLGAGERLVAEIDKLRTTDGPLPAQTRTWARVQLLAFEGQTRVAADEMWESSLSLWDRGARFASGLGMLSSIELNPDRARLELANERLREMPEAHALLAQAKFVEALLERDPDSMLSAVDALLDRGLIGLALSASQFAGSWFREADDIGGQRRAEARARSVRELNPDRTIDVGRFGAGAVALTEREKEVGRLAAEGLSNQEIATRLVLSVRTVESHMHRILRKLDVSSRSTLRRHMEALA